MGRLEGNQECTRIRQAPTTAAEIGVAEDDIIEALVMAHEIRPERYTILGDNGISKEAAYELAYKTEVI